MSAAGRKAIAAAQRARWAKVQGRHRGSRSIQTEKCEPWEGTSNPPEADKPSEGGRSPLGVRPTRLGVVNVMTVFGREGIPRKSGEPGGIRTLDPRLKRPLLYQLSYRLAECA